MKYPAWIANIVPVRKKNGQISICVDFRDFNKACPKDDFPLPIMEMMVDSKIRHEALSFMGGSSGYNQRKVADTHGLQNKKEDLLLQSHAVRAQKCGSHIPTSNDCHI